MDPGAAGLQQKAAGTARTRNAGRALSPHGSDHGGSGGGGGDGMAAGYIWMVACVQQAPP